MPERTSAPAKVPHRVVDASRESRIFRAQDASRLIRAPFFILMKPKAESSTS